MLSTLRLLYFIRVISHYFRNKKFLKIGISSFLLFISQFVNSQTYPAPSMFVPSSNSVIVQTTTNPCFSWLKVNDARFKSYVVTVSLSTNFPDQRWAYDITAINTTDICWNGGSGWVPKGTNPKPLSDAMKVGVTYYWRVLATYNDGSTVVGTDVAGVPFTLARPIPSPISPTNGSIIYSSSEEPCFSWSMPNNAEFGYYTITLSTTTDFPTTRWAYQINSISTTRVCWNNGVGWASKGSSPPPSPGPLQDGVTYYWRVLTTYTDGSISGQNFVGRSFVFKNNITSSKSSSSLRSSSSSSSSVDIPYVRPEQPVTAVGTTPYTTNVNHKGEAVVSIPIQVAPGIGDMQPQLSLVYNSSGTTTKVQNQTAGGLLGFGWSLTGISTIDRCTVGKPNVMGYISPSNKGLGEQTMRPKLKYDDTDNLCIDGEQLVLISGTHLRNGAVYRTYKESYRLITYQEFYDAEAKANAFRFEVRKPNGNIAIYGGGATSRVQKEIEYLGARTPVFTWGITTETDRSGNQTIYRYKKWEAFSYQANKQRLFPTSISYPGGNINFGYVEINSYTVPSAPAGATIEDDGVAAGPDRWRFNHDSGDQLTSIRTEARQYNIIGYGQSRSELRMHGLKAAAIQECGASVYMQYDQCLQPIKLDWLTRTTAYPEFPQSTSKYYEVAFLGGIVDSLGRKTEFQYDKIYGAYSTETRNKFSELPVTLPPTSGLSGVYDRTHGNKDKDNLNEIGFVVIQLKRGTGISSAPYILNYQYRAAGTVSNLGKGFLGFPAVRVEDPAKGVVSYRIYELDKSTLGPVGIFGEISAIYNYTGIYGTGEKPLFKKEFRYSIKTLTHTSVAKTYLPVVDQITELKYENGALLSATVKSNNYELLNTVLSTVTSNIKTGVKLNPINHSPQYWGHNAPYTLDPSSVKHEQTTITNLGFYNSFTDWRIGFISDITDKFYNGAAGVSATDEKTKQVKYTQKLGTTLVETETHFPGDAENEKIIAYTYNTKGQQEKITISGKNIETRTTQMLDYFPNNIAPQKIINAKGHETSLSDIDLRFNQPRKVTDANGLAVFTTLDAFARHAQVIDKNSVTTTTTYNSCVINFCAAVPGKLQSVQPVYYSETTSPIAPRIREFYDSLGRVVRIEKQGFANEAIYFDTQFDEFGRVYKTSMPYVAGATAYYETLIYDNKTNRLSQRIRPDGTAIITTYTTENIVANEPWLKVSVTDTVRSADGLSVFPRKKVSYLNSASQIMRVVDAEGTSQATTTTYEYDGLSNIGRAVVDGGADGITINNAVYDNAGNKIHLTDPNVGTTTNRYTALGELREVTDAENNVTKYRYDVLGRLNYRTNKDGTYNWYYDSQVKGTLAYTHDTQGFSKDYKYLNGRLDNITTDINISGQPARRFNESFKYDSYGRLQKTITPSGFTVTHRYNSYGYPSGLGSGDNSYSLWDISKQSALGIEEETLLGAKTIRGFDPESGRLEVLQSTQGVNKYQDLRYHWYSNGSLDRRDNMLKNITDTFSYDNHDRLNITDTKDYSTWVSKRQLNQQYSNLGNLKSNTSNNPADTNVNSYLYGTTTNAGPHAVSNVTINGSTFQLYYNRNGAVTQYDGPGTAKDKYIAYNVSNQPTNITLGLSLTDTNPTARDEFRYAEDGSLAYKKSTYQQSGVLRTEHTYYVGGYEVTFYDASSPLSKSEKTKIGRLLVTRNTPVSGSVVETLQALHLDYQGSVDAISGSNGLVQMAFEPFGVRRNTNLLGSITTTQLSDLLNSQTQYTADGYTGHRMLDRTGLIHMNGRVYDPVLGRFLSPDPVVQSPTNSQSWNRYSYVSNNPMKYTDPTGYEAEPVDEVVVTGTRGGCDELCQRKGMMDWFNSQMQSIDASNARWNGATETWGSGITGTFNTIPATSAACEGDLSCMVDVAEEVGEDGAILLSFAVGAGEAVVIVRLALIAKNVKHLGHATEAMKILQKYATQARNTPISKLLENLTDKELVAYLANPDKGKRFLGTAIHREVRDLLEKAYPGKFNYNSTRSFDFVDKKTGETLELTTTKQFADHASRLGEGTPIITYKPFP